MSITTRSNIVDLWTTPGAIMTIEFAPDETIAGVAVSDSHVLKADKRKNFLILKPEGCLIPEPMVVLTNLPSGELRRYSIQIETHPTVCQMPGPVRTASATDDPPPGNLKYISTDALAEGADVDYSVVYRYPGDEAAKRRAAARAAAESWRKEEANRILTASTTFDTKDPYSGERNLRYMWRGDIGLMPRWVWDNGYSTAFVFPASSACRRSITSLRMARSPRRPIRCMATRSLPPARRANGGCATATPSWRSGTSPTIRSARRPGTGTASPLCRARAEGRGE